MDRMVAEEILTGLKEEGLFQSYGFCKDGEKFCLLGQGRCSYVYEMYDRNHPENRYALKIIGLKGSNLSSEKFHQKIALQKKASECSNYVAKILTCDEILLLIDENKVLLQCILMEKLERLINVNSSGCMGYQRKELKEIPEKITLITQIVAAVAALHEENILHRDIKLENIFYDAKEGYYKLGDFSVSAYTETGSADTIIYTNGYGAPEVEQKTGAVYNDTADIYSLGMVMYLLFNNLKFPGSDGYYVNQVQYSEDFLFPACEEGTTEWTNLIRKMCSYRKELRYQSMGEVTKEINRIIRNTEKLVVTDREKLPLDGSTILYKNETKEQETVKDDRYEKKGIVYGILYYYTSRSRWHGIILSVLFSLLLGVMEPTVLLLDMEWQPRLMICLAVIETILLYLGELHILFGVGALITGVFFMLGTGQYVLFAVWLLGILYGIPMVGIAGIAGTMLWNIFVYFGWENYKGLIVTYHLEWVLVTFALLLVNRAIMLRQECAICERVKELAERILYYLIPIAFIFLDCINKYTEIVCDPKLKEVLNCVHPARVGVIVLTVNLMDYMAHRNSPRLGEYMWNEYLGKRGN